MHAWYVSVCVCGVSVDDIGIEKYMFIFRNDLYF